jgi:hypothetical protein
MDHNLELLTIPTRGVRFLDGEVALERSAPRRLP